jgi:LPXTG-site transpeptidase (sortase) family protein
MIYDNFRERKLNSQEKKAIDVFEEKIENKKAEEISATANASINYGNYTILGTIRIPKVGINTVIIKEQTYAAMNIGAIKSYGVDLNEEGGFVISAHNFRGKSTFFYSIKNLKSGDEISILDSLGRELIYKVYSVSRNVSPNDVSYLTTFYGYHVTLVTCENGGKARIVVKARVE